MITTMPAPSTHDCHHGFCTICGSVWPCSRAQRTTYREPRPIPRADELAR
jgi:hypothetical protein